MKIKDNLILVTPTKLDKARLTPDQIVEVTLDGEVLSEGLKPTSETPIHTKIYKKRPEVKAVIHSHPVTATSFASSDVEICKDYTPEAVIVLGEIVRTPFKLMWTEELGDTVSDATLKSDVVLMENHGTLTVGESLLEAFDKTEVLEATARMNLLTHLLNSKKLLSNNDLTQIASML